MAGPTSYTNQIGNVVRYAYAAAGRKTSEVLVGVMTNSFTYTPAGDPGLPGLAQPAWARGERRAGSEGNERWA